LCILSDCDQSGHIPIGSLHKNRPQSGRTLGYETLVERKREGTGFIRSLKESFIYVIATYWLLLFVSSGFFVYGIMEAKLPCGLYLLVALAFFSLLKTSYSFIDIPTDSSRRRFAEEWEEVLQLGKKGKTAMELPDNDVKGLTEGDSKQTEAELGEIRKDVKLIIKELGKQKGLQFFHYWLHLCGSVAFLGVGMFISDNEAGLWVWFSGLVLAIIALIVRLILRKQ
jgi:hypothetical protein